MLLPLLLLSPPILAQYGSTARCQSSTRGKQTGNNCKVRREAAEKQTKRKESGFIAAYLRCIAAVTTCNKSLSP
ncbi:hypothetical protein GBF38_017720 [Nibea albiflora]|uniref:Uncharacterized protein n=1 Tax=Nibea albiflora TaxID=240163 RepID=A0ACB7F5Z2_NIBAL|nr:hypothetical protein GBF38_017720 [Nibea albiflora]